jgi:transcriptional regulator with XRE-family HTH domain
MPDHLNFGSALRRARIEAEMSLGELAKQVNYSKGYLSKIENGVSVPSVPMARRCAAAVGAGADLAALVTARPARKAVGAGQGGTADLLLSAETGIADMAFAPVGLLRESNPNLEAEYVTIFQQLRELGRRVQPAAVLPMLSTQVAVLRRFIDVTDEPERGRLTLLTARCAEYAGWMAQEAGDDAAAQRWTSAAERLAAEAGDRDLVAYTLVRQAEFTLYHEDPLGTVELAGRAARLPEVSLRIKALAAHREAQGHALAGEAKLCEKALERATEDLRAADGRADSGTLLGSTTVTDLGSVVAGWCAYDLGSTSQAIELLEAGLAGIPGRSTRVRTVFASRLALAHEAAGHHDEVDRLATEILEVVPLIESASVRSQLRILGRALVRGSHRSRARHLHAAFAEALRDPNRDR